MKTRWYYLVVKLSTTNQFQPSAFCDECSIVYVQIRTLLLLRVSFNMYSFMQSQIHNEGEFRRFFFFYLAIWSLFSSFVGINVTGFLTVLKHNARHVPQGVPLLRCSSFLYKKITSIHCPVSAVEKKGFSVRIIAFSLCF